MMHSNYADALYNNDKKSMLRHACRLYQAYGAIGNKILAKKWTEEYIRCWIEGGWNPPDEELQRYDPPVIPESAVAVRSKQ